MPQYGYRPYRRVSLRRSGYKKYTSRKKMFARKMWSAYNAYKSRKGMTKRYKKRSYRKFSKSYY